MNLARRSERPVVLFPAQAQWTGVPPTFGDLQFIFYQVWGFFLLWRCFLPIRSVDVDARLEEEKVEYGIMASTGCIPGKTYKRCIPVTSIYYTVYMIQTSKKCLCRWHSHHHQHHQHHDQNYQNNLPMTWGLWPLLGSWSWLVVHCPKPLSPNN